jgi:hypothetical protein
MQFVRDSSEPTSTPLYPPRRLKLQLVVIGMSGVLQAWDTPSQSIGLSCALGTATGANTWTREGGTFAAGQTTTTQFRVHADSTGQGTIVLSLNPSRTLDERDYSNNLQIFNVTVK